MSAWRKRLAPQRLAISLGQQRQKLASAAVGGEKQTKRRKRQEWDDGGFGDRIGAWRTLGAKIYKQKALAGRQDGWSAASAAGGSTRRNIALMYPASSQRREGNRRAGMLAQLIAKCGLSQWASGNGGARYLWRRSGSADRLEMRNVEKYAVVNVCGSNRLRGIMMTSELRSCGGDCRALTISELRLCCCVCGYRISLPHQCGSANVSAGGKQWRRLYAPASQARHLIMALWHGGIWHGAWRQRRKLNGVSVPSYRSWATGAATQKQSVRIKNAGRKARQAAAHRGGAAKKKHPAARCSSPL